MFVEIFHALNTSHIHKIMHEKRKQRSWKRNFGMIMNRHFETRYIFCIHFHKYGQQNEISSWIAWNRKRYMVIFLRDLQFSNISTHFIPYFTLIIHRKVFINQINYNQMGWKVCQPYLPYSSEYIFNELWRK